MPYQINQEQYSHLKSASKSIAPAIGGIIGTVLLAVFGALPENLTDVKANWPTYAITICAALAPPIKNWWAHRDKNGHVWQWFTMTLFCALIIGAMPGCQTTHFEQTLESGENVKYTNVSPRIPGLKQDEDANSLHMKVNKDGSYEITANQKGTGIDTTQTGAVAAQMLEPLAPLFGGAGIALQNLTAPKPVEKPEPKKPVDK